MIPWKTFLEEFLEIFLDESLETLLKTFLYWRHFFSKSPVEMSEVLFWTNFWRKLEFSDPADRGYFPMNISSKKNLQSNNLLLIHQLIVLFLRIHTITKCMHLLCPDYFQSHLDFNKNCTRASISAKSHRTVPPFDGVLKSKTRLLLISAFKATQSVNSLMYLPTVLYLHTILLIARATLFGMEETSQKWNNNKNNKHR